MKNHKRRILFIAWDAAHVNYLEGLFGPILSGLQLKCGYEIHILHFTWADATKINALRSFCSAHQLVYSNVPVVLKPVAALGKFFTLYKGVRVIRNYICANSIDIVMPRSSMPAKMVLSAIKNNRSIRIVYDADGLPIEERVELAGLKVNSLRYGLLKSIERKILMRADRVLMRSHKAIAILTDQHKLLVKSKFFVVKNGRSEAHFTPLSEGESMAVRDQLSIPHDAFVMVYCGSLGPQYGVEEMAYIHRRVLAKNENAWLLLLVTNPEFINRTPLKNAQHIVVKNAAYQDVPKFLSVANVAMAIRQQTLSMKGVAPIKLGEYFLMGLPVIASARIGDTEELLQGKEFAYILHDHTPASLELAVDWINKLAITKSLKESARAFGEEYFGLAAAVDSYANALKGL